MPAAEDQTFNSLDMLTNAQKDSTSGLSRFPEGIKKALLLVATHSAYALPEEVDSGLLLVWLEDTRGTSLHLSNEPDSLDIALQQFAICCSMDNADAIQLGTTR